MARRCQRLTALAALVLGTEGALDVNCSAALDIRYDIPYYASKVDCGNLFIKSDVATVPTVTFAPASPAKAYTLVYISTCSHCDKSFPDNSEEGLVHVHYVAANIDAATLSGSGDVANADQYWAGDFPRHGPGPSQRYNFYLFQHDGATPAALNATTCWPANTQYCSQADFTNGVVDAPFWDLVAAQYLTGLYYNDTFRGAL